MALKEIIIVYNELKYTKWYKIPVHDLHEMCNMSNYNKYTLAYYPMLKLLSIY